MRELATVFSHVQGLDEFERFIVAFFTPNEAKTQLNRWKILCRRLSDEGYDDIRKELGVGSQTISRASAVLSKRNEAEIIRTVYQRYNSVKKGEIK